MTLLNLTPRKIGLIISLVVSILINSFQMIVVLFDITLPHKGVVAMMENMPSPQIDLTINIFYCFILSWLVFEINNYLIYRLKGWFNLVVRLVLSFLISSVLIYAFGHTYIFYGNINDPFAFGIIMHFRSLGVMISFLMTGLVQMLYLYKNNHNQKIEMERLLSENIRSKYIALKNQVDPHFLFNSLNTLSGLITVDSSRAQEYLQRLSAIFRYSMQDRELVTVGAEVEFAKTFGELMRVRYGDALLFNYDIPEEISRRKIMPFSLQLLIENAVKHNVIIDSKPLEIDIFYCDDRIFVKNRVNPKREKELGEGIGLVNLSKRYELFGDYRIEITHQNNIFSVSLPLINDEYEINNHRR